MSFPSAPILSRREAALAYAVRFTDTLLESALGVLMPVIHAQFGLSYSAISALRSIGSYVEAATEPVGGMALDVWPRRVLLGGGAIVLGVGTAVIGVAPGFWVLALGFALVGGAGGPTRQASDVVLVEANRGDSGAILARITMLGTAGALSGPLLASAWLASGVDWRGLQVLLGLLAVVYGVAMLRADFPLPRAVAEAGTSFIATMRANFLTVMRDRSMVVWLVFLRVFYLMDAPAVFETLWLADVGRMSPSLIGVYVASEMGAALFGNFALQRWLGHVSPSVIVLVASTGMLVLFPAWFLVPGTVARFAIGLPLAVVWSVLWPVARGESLRGTDRPGAVSAVNSLTGLLLPITLGIGLLADRIGLTPAMLGVRMIGTVVLVVLASRWLPRR